MRLIIVYIKDQYDEMVAYIGVRTLTFSTLKPLVEIPDEIMVYYHS